MYLLPCLLDWNPLAKLRHRDSGINPGADRLDTVRLEDIVKVGFVVASDFPRRGNPNGVARLLPFCDGAAQRLVRRAGLRIIVPASDDETSGWQRQLCQTAQGNPGFEPS